MTDQQTKIYKYNPYSVEISVQKNRTFSLHSSQEYYVHGQTDRESDGRTDISNYKVVLLPSVATEKIKTVILTIIKTII